VDVAASGIATPLLGKLGFGVYISVPELCQTTR
jgi:hypothetical protein